LNKRVTDSGKDGMDVALCSIDKNTKELHYSGAYNPLLIIRDHTLIEFKADKFIIGNASYVQNNLFYINKFVKLKR
jgi:hypothetical protein